MSDTPARPTARIYPLDHPNLPLPGPYMLFLAAMKEDGTVLAGPKTKQRFVTIGRELRSMVKQALYRPFQLSVPDRDGVERAVTMLPGHFWNDYEVPGPHRRGRVLVVGQAPGRHEMTRERHFCGPAGAYLRETLLQYGFTPEEMQDWYLTNVVRFMPPYEVTGNVPAAWVREGLHLFHQELRLVRPDYILALGAAATKVLYGNNASVMKLLGSYQTYEFPIDDENIHQCQVVCVNHPSQVLHQPESEGLFTTGINRFQELLSGQAAVVAKRKLDHRIVDNTEDLARALERIDKNPSFLEHNAVAVDAEWEGEHPVNRGSYVRMAQFSWETGSALGLRFTEPGGAPAWKHEGRLVPTPAPAIDLLDRWFHLRPKKIRVVGQFLVADLEWLVPLGLDLRKLFEVPRQKSWDDEPWWRTKDEGGFDTGIAAHEIDECGDLKLELLAARYTDVIRYDGALVKWRQVEARRLKVKAENLEGYGRCPHEILEPYGLWDADAAFRLFLVLNKMLDADQFGLPCREGFWRTMRALPGIYEINTNGLMIDTDRFEGMTKSFLFAKERLETSLREWAQWPDLNFESDPQIREFLFGSRWNGAKKKPGKPKRLRPPGAKSLFLTPMLTTGKKAKPWKEEYYKAKDPDKLVPSAAKATLEILKSKRAKHAYREQVSDLFDLRVVATAIKNIAKPPVRDKAGKIVRNEHGKPRYLTGLGRYLDDDHRVRTHIYPTTETWRWRSSRPNAQNYSSNREKDYKRVLGELYQHGVRSLFKAAPGCVLVEADYSGAELALAAFASADPEMIKHAVRMALPEEHEDHYDIHCNITALVFEEVREKLQGQRLVKEVFEKNGFKELRNITKTIVFGLMYGRSARAISIEAQMQGSDLSEEQAEEIIEAVFQVYPMVKYYLDECDARAGDPRYLCSIFGTRRRFPPTDNEKILRGFGRSAKNFPIQGGVAMVVNAAVDAFMSYREDVGRPDLYKLVLQIHDALLFEIPVENVEFFIDEVLPYCMVDQVPIYPRDLSGQPTGTGPYYLGYEAGVYEYWKQTLYKDDCRRLGLAERFGKEPKQLSV
jgi:uracil-DNA glycosylase family 4